MQGVTEINLTLQDRRRLLNNWAAPLFHSSFRLPRLGHICENTLWDACCTGCFFIGTPLKVQSVRSY